MALMTQVGMEFIARDKSRMVVNNFNRNLTSMTRSFMRLAGVGGGLYLAQLEFRSFIQEASNAQETAAKFNVVFRDQARSVRQWAEDFGDSVGRATHDVEKWSAGLQDTFVPLGIARDKAAELSKSLVELAVDVASFNNKADADVIRDFTSALVGNHETVRKYGIIISESAIKQEAWAQGLNKTFAQLTDLEKVQLRYRLIQAGTTDAQGDAIRTADSYANQIKRLSANWKEFKVEAGTPLITVLADMTSGMNKGYEASKKWTVQLRETIDALGQVYDEYMRQQERTKNLARPGPGIFGGFGAGSMGVPPTRSSAIETLPQGQLIIPPRRQQYLEEMRERARLINETMNFQGQFPGTEFASQAAEEIKITTDMQKQIVSDTRDYLESIRSMHDKTRQEKIQILDNYIAEHSKELEKIPEAERLIAKERLSIEKSRVDQMKVYMAELREDMQSWEQYQAEKFAETARSIESSMSGAFQRMIREGASWKDAMRGFLTDVADAFARMAADMAARAIMANAVMPIAGGIASGFSSLFASFFEKGGVVGRDGEKRLVPAAIFAGAPSFKNGLPGDAFPAILHQGESVIPAGTRMSAPSIVIYNESGQAIEQKKQPEFDGESWVVSLIAKNVTQGGSLSKMLRG